jgi:D-serine deaminase-like pyridoxal phosphate-dependent protein
VSVCDPQIFLARLSMARYHRGTMEKPDYLLSQFPWDERYRVVDVEHLLTPALVVYPEVVASNINATLRLLDGNADRWRAHIKTAKLGYTLRMLVDRGIRNFKCATTLELITACENGAADVLVAYPLMGANAERVREISRRYPHVEVSVLAEDPEQLRQWQGTRVGVFLDIDPGMNRTGIAQSDTGRVVRLIGSLRQLKIEFRGLHYYDGQYGHVGESERMAGAHAGYDRLLELVNEIQRNGFRVKEIVTAGTPTFPCSLAYKGFSSPNFVHRVSPGTVVYCDATSLAQLPRPYGYKPAALVMARVVSYPAENIVTCDAGHKTVSADSGVPTCVVVGHPEVTPISPSEEHLPLRMKGRNGLHLGELLYLLPRHICPTVNNFDLALLVRNGHLESVEKVSARGREAPLLHPSYPAEFDSPPVVAQKN